MPAARATSCRRGSGPSASGSRCGAREKESPDAESAADERHRTEDGPPELSGVDANRALERVRKGLAACGAPERIREITQIGEADREVDRDNVLLPGRER